MELMQYKTAFGVCWNIDIFKIHIIEKNICHTTTGVFIFDFCISIYVLEYVSNIVQYDLEIS